MKRAGGEFSYRIASFVNSKEKYIFHYLGNNDHPGRLEIDQALDKAKKKIWEKGAKDLYVVRPNPQNSHPNIVVDQFFEFFESKLSRMTPDETESRGPDPHEHSPRHPGLPHRIKDSTVSDYFDTLRDVRAVMDSLQFLPQRKSESSDAGAEGTVLLVFEDAENIFGRHLLLSDSVLDRERFSQWVTLLKEIIELNSPLLAIKILLISGEELYPLLGLSDFLIEEDSRNAPWALSRNESPGQRTMPKSRRPSSIYLSPDVLAYSEKISRRLDMETAHGEDFADLCVRFVEEYAREIIDRIRLETKEPRAELIVFQRMHSLYEWVKYLAPAIRAAKDNQNAFPSNGSRESMDNCIGNMYATLARLLCYPLQGRLFNDLGNLLLNFRYDHHLHEAFEDIQEAFAYIKDPDALIKAATKPARFFIDRRLTVRLKVLQGNQYYYNYPENYTRALTHYVEALELLLGRPRKARVARQERNTRDEVEKKRGLLCNRFPCKQLEALMYYEVASCIHEVFSRGYFKILAQSETRELKTGLERLVFLIVPNPLQRLVYAHRLFGDKARADASAEDQLLTVQRLLLKRLTKVRDTHPGYATHVDCWRQISTTKESQHRREHYAGRDGKGYTSAIPYRQIVTRLKLLQSIGISDWGLMQILIPVLKWKKWSSSSLRPIHFFTPFLARASGRIERCVHMRLGLRFRRTRDLLAQIRRIESKLMPLSVVRKGDRLDSAEPFWKFLSIWHFWRLVTKELTRFLKRWDEARQREGSQHHRFRAMNDAICSSFLAVVESIIEEIGRLLDSMKPRSGNASGAEKPEDAKTSAADLAGVQDASTYRVARTYEMLGDVQALRVRCERQAQAVQNEASLDVTLDFYTQAADRYIRIGSHYLYEKVREKMDQLKDTVRMSKGDAARSS